MLSFPGGNQREQARQKGLKAEKGKNKPAEEQEGNKGMSLQERKQRYPSF